MGRKLAWCQPVLGLVVALTLGSASCISNRARRTGLSPERRRESFTEET